MMNFIRSTPVGKKDLDLGEKLKKSLKSRLSVGSYNKSEIDTIRSKNHRFSARSTADLRNLARFANITLPNPTNIKSHRKFAGPLIVTVKKVFWRFLRIFLTQLVDGIRAFAIYSTKKTVEHSSRISELEKKVERLTEQVEGQKLPESKPGQELQPKH